MDVPFVVTAWQESSVRRPKVWQVDADGRQLFAVLGNESVWMLNKDAKIRGSGNPGLRHVIWFFLP